MINDFIGDTMPKIKIPLNTNAEKLAKKNENYIQIK